MKTYNLSGSIGDELQIQNFTDLITDAAGQDFELNFNSLGGYVSDGFVIYNMIRDYPGRKTIVLNGHTASIASYIAMAFDEIVIRDNTAFMIHNAWGGVIGNSKDVEDYANYLKNISDIIAIAYVKKTGKSKKEILDMMEKETWLYGREIVDNGFADRMIDGDSQEIRTVAVLKASRAFNDLRLPAIKDDMQRAVAMYKKDDNWIDEAKDLIEKGKYNIVDNSDKPIQNGVVMRSALRRMVSRADAENKTEIAELISIIDKKNKGGNSVTKQEILDAVKTAKENNELTLKELAIAMNAEDKIMDDKHIKALNMVEVFAKMEIDDPVATLKTALETINKTEKDRVENKIKSEFDPNGLGEKNLLLTHALNTLKDKSEKEIDEAIKNFKVDPISKKLAGEMADYTSDVNKIGYVDGDQKNQDFAKAKVLKL